MEMIFAFLATLGWCLAVVALADWIEGLIVGDDDEEGTATIYVEEISLK